MHTLLKEQLGSHFNGSVPEELLPLFEKINAVYEEWSGELSVLQKSVNKNFEQLRLKSEDLARLQTYTRALKSELERYTIALQGSREGLWEWDLKSNVVYFSPRWKALLGYQDGQIGSSPEEWFSRIYPDDEPAVRKAFDFNRSGFRVPIEIECRMMHAGGEYKWTLVQANASFDDKGVIQRLAGIQSDISRRKATEEQLRHDALHDHLTGLANRILFLDRLHYLLERCKRQPAYRFAILFIDLDRFKVTNDSLGHLFGDQMLVKIGEKLGRCVRSLDLVARLGGDEFAVLLDDVQDIGDAIRVSKRAQKAITTSLQVHGQETYITASIGIAIGTSETESAETLVQEADIAMYQAKARGKARHEIFEPEMRSLAVDLFHLENDLRRALKNGEFELYYQPIFCSRTKKILRFESLIRWNHPKRGLVSPKSFIPLAEETGLIIEIGEWVTRTACLESKKWEAAFGTEIGVAVNFSATQFQSRNIAAMIQNIINTTGVRAVMIEVEITESTAMKSVEYTQQLLKDIKAMGVRIAIDDFGIGYSSLGCIHMFPVDTIKIDQSFTREIPENACNTVITGSVIAMSHALGLKVVAEGVETASQMQCLLKNQCDELQGYYLSRPMPAADVPGFIQRHLDKPVF